MWAWTVTPELNWAMWRRAASALGRLSRASASSKRTWRWRLEGSTKSRSMRVRLPTAGAGKQRSGGRAHGSAADDGDMRLGEPLLAGGADAGEEHLAGVAVGIGDGRGFVRALLGECASACSFERIVIRSIGNCGARFPRAWQRHASSRHPGFAVKPRRGTCRLGHHALGDEVRDQ